MIRVVVFGIGALMALLVAVEAANFAIYHMSLKALSNFRPDTLQLDLRIWTAIGVASVAWIASVKLTAATLDLVRSRYRQQ